MFFVYLNILTQSVAITDSMFNIDNYLTKKTLLTFDQKEIEKKKISRRHEVVLRIQCCHKKMSKSQEKNSTFFLKYFQQNRHFLKTLQIFRKHKVYFQILEVLPVILTTCLPV